jgi:hypothetical protein
LQLFEREIGGPQRGLLTEEHSLDRRDDGPTIARQLVLRLG